MSKSRLFDDALFINRDACWSKTDLVGWDASTKERAEETVRAFFKKFTGHSITDIPICIYENTSLVPSKKVLWRALKLFRTEENGEQVSFDELRDYYKLYAEHGIDPIKIFFEIANESGIRPWLAFRINDIHHWSWKVSFLRDDFFYEAKRRGMMLGEDYGYFNSALNFEYDEVRDRFLGYLEEMLEIYEPFGIEIDFMREMHCLRYLTNENKHKIMTEFMKNIKKIAERAGERYGRKVYISVRMSRSLKDSYDFGFDVKEWVKHGLIDVVVPSPRWDITDSSIPIDEWRRELGDEVAILPCVELNNVKKTMTDVATAKAYSAAWNAMGADGLYFYNHDYATTWHKKVYDLRKSSVLDGERRFILTEQDFAPIGNEKYKPLPLSVDGSAALAFNCGPIRDCDTSRLIIDFDGEVPKIKANGISLCAATKIPPIVGFVGCNADEDYEKREITSAQTYSYELPIKTDGNITLEFEGNCTCYYVEVRING